MAPDPKEAMLSIWGMLITEIENLFKKLTVLFFQISKFRGLTSEWT